MHQQLVESFRPFAPAALGLSVRLATVAVEMNLAVQADLVIDDERARN